MESCLPALAIGLLMSSGSKATALVPRHLRQIPGLNVPRRSSSSIAC